MNNDRLLVSPLILFFVFLFCAVRAFAGGATLAWDPETNPAVVGYALYYGPGGSNTKTNSRYITVSAPPLVTTTLASSANPATIGASVTFTATVTGSNPTGTVAFANGGSVLAGCSAVALAGSGNTKTAACS